MDEDEVIVGVRLGDLERVVYAPELGSAAMSDWAESVTRLEYVIEAARRETKAA